MQSPIYGALHWPAWVAAERLVRVLLCVLLGVFPFCASRQPQGSGRGSSAVETLKSMKRKLDVMLPGQDSSHSNLSSNPRRINESISNTNYTSDSSGELYSWGSFKPTMTDAAMIFQSPSMLASSHSSSSSAFLEPFGNQTTPQSPSIRNLTSSQSPLIDLETIFQAFHKYPFT